MLFHHLVANPTVLRAQEILRGSWYDIWGIPGYNSRGNCRLGVLNMK